MRTGKNTHRRRPTGKPLVSVVVVNFNGKEFLGPCLESVKKQPYRPIEIIVVDNASSDGSVQFLRKTYPRVRLIVNAANRGFAAANNQGVEAAKGEYVALLNNDTTVERRWLQALLGMIRKPGTGVVTSRVITEGVPREFYEMNGTINYLGYNVMREFADLSTVFFAGGASLMFHRRTVGLPFLPEFFLYHEDAYLSWRMRLAGYRIAMAQGSVVHHRGSASVKRQPNSLVSYYQERNRLLNCLLFYETRTLVRLVPYFIAEAGAKILLSILARRKSFAAILRAYWWVATHGSWIGRERRALQATRVVPDGAILSLMSSKVVEGEGAFPSALNRVSRFYADLAGLRYHE